MTDRKKPGVAFWASVVVVVPLLYVLSTGPAIWFCGHTDSDALDEAVLTIYAPIEWLYETSPAFAELWEPWRDIWGA